MKKLCFILALLVLTIPSFVLATNYVDITGDIVRIRTSPSTSGSILTSSNSGSRYTLKDTNLVSDQGGCSAGWYKIDYNGQDAYVCSEYSRTIINDVSVDPNATSACEKELSGLGFSKGYYSKLCELKVSHPNWVFKPINTGLNWVSIVNQESSCSNTISSNSNSDYIDSSCSGRLDYGYSYASNKAVAYYMNPLNFLDEKNIFMFESANTNPNIDSNQLRKASDYVYPSSNFLVKNIPSFTEYVRNASVETGASQLFLISRIKQELGNAKLGSGAIYAGQLFSAISGNYTTRFNKYYNGNSLDNYYNFYNIGAFDGSDITYNALVYAFNHGWGGTGNQNADRQKAMTGGASYIKSSYIDKGQDNIYFQKWNTHPSDPSKVGMRQYMTNVQAVTSEASILYSAYKSAGLLDSPFEFYIPIYNNLDGNIINEDAGAKEDDTKKDEPKKDLIEPSTMIVSSGLKLNNNIVSGINPNSNVVDIKGKIQSMGGSILILNNNNQEVNDGLVGTGFTLRISNGGTSSDFKVLIKGDASGDGKISGLDLLKVQKNILGIESLSNEFSSAADVSNDGKVSGLDLLKIQKYILGIDNIEQ